MIFSNYWEITVKTTHIIVKPIHFVRKLRKFDFNGKKKYIYICGWLHLDHWSSLLLKQEFWSPCIVYWYKIEFWTLFVTLVSIIFYLGFALTRRNLKLPKTKWVFEITCRRRWNTGVYVYFWNYAHCAQSLCRYRLYERNSLLGHTNSWEYFEKFLDRVHVPPPV